MQEQNSIKLARLRKDNSQSQKSYRYVQLIAHRLDAQVRNASSWKEFFDADINTIRQKLKDTCEEVIFDVCPEDARRIEDILWRKGFYEIIQKLRQDRKLLQSDCTLRAIYNAHLTAAHSFYHHLINRINVNFKSSVSNAVEWLSQTNELSKEEILEEGKKLVLKWCQRCFLYLGDLARYKIDIEGNEAVRLAEKLYHEAILVFPDNGMPHNQLGTLKQQAGYSDFEIAYHYFRCMHSVISFNGAEENLQKILDRNRLVKKAVKTSQSDALGCFLVDFLELNRMFLNERLHPDDFTTPCQLVIEKFIEILKILENKIQANVITLIETHPECSLTEILMMKVFAMCIMMGTELQKRESDVVSAVIAFTLTLLSKLLDFVSKILPLCSPGILMTSLQKSEDGRKRNLSKNKEQSYDAKQKEDKKMKHSRRRRRKKLNLSDDSIENMIFQHDSDNTSTSDLSEGETFPESIEQSDSYSSAENDSEYGDPIQSKTSDSLKLEELSPRSLRMYSNQANIRSSLLSFVNGNCYLSTLKLMSDWIQYCDPILDVYGKNIPSVWKKYAKLFSELPSDETLFTWLHLISVEKNSEFIENIKNTTFRQTKALPEDVSLIGLSMFSKIHSSLNFLKEEKSKNSLLLQFIVRVKVLKAFGHFLSSKQLLEWPENYPNDGCCITYKDSSWNQEHVMKALAKQKLLHDVSHLKNKTSCRKKDESSSDLPTYLIMDSGALCRHLSLIRSMIRSREFIIIIPIQVVQVLDELKKYNPSAREATKFLEAEFKQKSRWLRLQRHYESLDSVKTDVGKRNKKFSFEEWRFIQVVKCAYYFASKHGNDGIVSILTAKPLDESSGSLGTRVTPAAVSLCSNLGIQISYAFEFYQKWTSKKNL